jgi:uncharacterized protein
MMSTGRRRGALSSMDIPDSQEPLVHACEDCACAVSGTRARRTVPDVGDGPLVLASGLVDLPIDDEHSLLFNPHGNGQVVVLDAVGRAVAAGFATPARVSAAVADDVARLVAADVVHPVGRAPTQDFQRDATLTAWLHVTNKCNLRCPYCYVHKSDDSMSQDVAERSVDALVASAVRNGFEALRLKYAGGEASLNADVLVGLHDYARDRCAAEGLALSAVLLSNGVALHDRLVDALRAREIGVMVSLDGLGAGHDAQRPTLGGRPSSALVIRTVDRLVAAGVAPHISITITGRNTADVAGVVRFAVDRGLTFSMNFFRDNDCAATFDDLQYEQRAMIDGLAGAFRVIEQTLPPWSVLGSVLDRGQLLMPRQRPCGVADDYVVIDQNGRIAQCHMDIETTVGDIRTADPVSAVRAGGIKNLLVEDKAGCRDCSWRQWCAGGCPLATHRATGRFDVRSPNCAIYKAIYPQALRLEGLRILKYAVT